MPVISSRISGCRVTDSMTLPKMNPMPTPAPTAPRPPPTPRAIALPSSPDAARTERRVDSMGSPLLVALGDRAAEVDGAEHGEDEGLQRRHEAQLEEVEEHAGRQGEDPEHLEAEQHGEAAGHEEDDQVTGEDVGEQSYGEREQPHEVREQLEPAQRRHAEPADDARAADALRDEALEVAADALGPDALDVEGDEDDEREDERHGEVRRARVEGEGRDLEPEHLEGLVRVRRQRDVADEVREPDEEEQRGQEREPLAGHLVVHVAARDVVADERVDGLHGGLHAVGPRLHAARDVDHRDDGQRGGEDHVEHALVDVERTREVDPGVELELALRLELLVVLPLGPEDQDDDDDREDVDAEDAEQDLFGAAHPKNLRPTVCSTSVSAK